MITIKIFLYESYCLNLKQEPGLCIEAEAQLFKSTSVVPKVCIVQKLELKDGVKDKTHEGNGHFNH